MRNFYLSRREAVSAALAALLARIGWPRPACAAGETIAEDLGGEEPTGRPSSADGRVVATYSYDRYGRLLSFSTAVDPDASTRWAY